MKFDSADTNHRSWQESLDPQLTRRLMRPVSQPGVASTHLAESILLRMQAMTDRSPLAEQLGRRQHWVEERSADAVPIVYARPRSNSLGQNVSATDSQQSVQRAVNSSSARKQPPVIQAKFVSPPKDPSRELSKKPLVRASSNNVPLSSNGRGGRNNKPANNYNGVVQRQIDSSNDVPTPPLRRSKPIVLPAKNQIGGNNSVVQRLSSSNGSLTSRAEIVQRSPVIDPDSGGGTRETIALDNEVDIEELVDRVQRRLAQRLTIETERRGLRGLTKWI